MATPWIHATHKGQLLASRRHASSSIFNQNTCFFQPVRQQPLLLIRRESSNEKKYPSTKNMSNTTPQQYNVQYHILVARQRQQILLPASSATTSLHSDAELTKKKNSPPEAVSLMLKNLTSGFQTSASPSAGVIDTPNSRPAKPNMPSSTCVESQFDRAGRLWWRRTVEIKLHRKVVCRGYCCYRRRCSYPPAGGNCTNRHVVF